MASFPYPFRLTVNYTLTGHALRITIKVKNTGPSKLPFGLGGHPGFRVPLVEGRSFSDYTIIFEQEEYQNCSYIDENRVRQVDKYRLVLNNTRVLPLNYEDYKHNALVFEDLNSSFLELKGPDGSPGFFFKWEGFSYFAIWNPYNLNAPFICLEPWTSSPPRSDEDYVFDNKHGIQLLGSGESYKAWFEIEPY